MKNKETIVGKIAKWLNGVAGFSIVAMMVLVVFNVLLRVLFKKPILGTYEYVGFLAAIIVGLGLAYCAIVNGHIAIGFIMEKFKLKTQNLIDVVTNAFMFCIMMLTSGSLFAYAVKLAENGEVSPTTQNPFYLFVCVVAFSFLVLSAVILLKVIKAAGRLNKQ